MSLRSFLEKFFNRLNRKSSENKLSTSGEESPPDQSADSSNVPIAEIERPDDLEEEQSVEDDVPFDHELFAIKLIHLIVNGFEATELINETIMQLINSNNVKIFNTHKQRKARDNIALLKQADKIYDLLYQVAQGNADFVIETAGKAGGWDWIKIKKRIVIMII